MATLLGPIPLPLPFPFPFSVPLPRFPLLGYIWVLRSVQIVTTWPLFLVHFHFHFHFHFHYFHYLAFFGLLGVLHRFFLSTSTISTTWLFLLFFFLEGGGAFEGFYIVIFCPPL